MELKRQFHQQQSARVSASVSALTGSYQSCHVLANNDVMVTTINLISRIVVSCDRILLRLKSPQFNISEMLKLRVNVLS